MKGGQYMPIKDFITTVLNIGENDIESIKTINNSGKSFDIFLTLKSYRPSCIYCGGPTKSKGFSRSSISLPNLSSLQCTLHWARRRYVCNDCQKSFVEHNRFAPEGLSASYSLLREIMIDFSNPRMTVTDISKKSHISVTQLTKYFDSFVNVPVLPLPESLGIDELHSSMSNRDSAYLCVFVDNENRRLTEILPSRSKRTLSSYFSKIPLQERKKVRFVTIDMWEPYKSVVSRYLPDAIIAVDPFHVVKTLCDGFTKLRVEIMKDQLYGSAGYYLLKKWHKLLESDDYDLSMDAERKYNHFFKQKLNYYDLQQLVLNVSTELKLAYNLKEMYRDFNRHCRYEDAGSELNYIMQCFIKVDLSCYREFVSMVQNWKKEIIASFIRPYDNRKLSNSFSEYTNRRLRELINASNGLNNFVRFRNRAVYCFNKQISYSLSNFLYSNSYKKPEKQGSKQSRKF